MNNNDEFYKKDYYSQVRIRFTSFIVKIIKNAALNYKKRRENIRKKETSNSEIIDNERTFNTEGLSFFVQENFDYKHLECYLSETKYYKAVKKLNEKQKKILYLRYIKNYNYKEIAKILRLKESSVRTIKSRAIKEINKTLNNEGNKKNE